MLGPPQRSPNPAMAAVLLYLYDPWPTSRCATRSLNPAMVAEVIAYVPVSHFIPLVCPNPGRSCTSGGSDLLPVLAMSLREDFHSIRCHRDSTVGSWGPFRTPLRSQSAPWLARDAFPACRCIDSTPMRPAPWPSLHHKPDVLLRILFVVPPNPTLRLPRRLTTA